MIGDAKTIEKLYDCFMARGGNTIRDPDEIFDELHAGAGVVWKPNDPKYRLPDRQGRNGSWWVVNGDRFLIWKMKPVR